MMVKHVKGATRVLGKSQGYIGLPVRDETMLDIPTGMEISTMTTSWEPTPDELAALNAGAAVYVRIYGQDHPPIIVGVGPPPGDI